MQDKVVVQTYDGAAAMARHLNGVRHGRGNRSLINFHDFISIYLLHINIDIVYLSLYILELLSFHFKHNTDL